MEKPNAIERLLWSVALPGFGQFLNQKYIKGITLLICEILINVQSHFNEAIMLSFQGDISQAIERTNYQWLMFYPCIYFFAIWDAYKDAGGGRKPYSFVPFVLSAYFVTVGLMYSDTLKIFGILFGPIWLPMIFVIPGIALGLFIRSIILMSSKNKT